MLSLIENSTLMLSSYSKKVSLYNNDKKNKNNLNSSSIKSFCLNLFFSLVIFFLLNYLLILLSKYNFIDLPYGFFGVDYADDRYKYIGWSMADLEKERLSFLDDYEYNEQKVSDCNKKYKLAKDTAQVFKDRVDAGWRRRPLDRLLPRCQRHYESKARAYERELEDLNRIFEPQKKKMELVNEALKLATERWKASARGWDGRIF